MGNLKRIFGAGFIHFWRNGWLSLATVSIFVLTLIMVVIMLFIALFTHTLSAELESKIGISAYFQPDTAESQILQIKDDLSALPQVQSVNYISQDQALQNFKDRHANDPVSLQALAELQTNPFEASLNIRAQNPNQYQSISDYLNNHYSSVLDKVDYAENQDVISRISGFIVGLRFLGIVLTAILALIALLISFNTIRLVIYNSREEIRIMSLVGATNWFVRGPFLVNGGLQGLVASVVAFFISWPLIYYFSPKLQLFLPDLNIHAYFLNHMWWVYGTLFVFGVGIGVLGSLLAIRRYLREN